MTDKKPVVSTLERLLWKIHELESTVRAYPPNGAEILEDRFTKFLEELKELKKQSEGLGNRIPIDLLRYVDEGGNPDVYTKEVFKAAYRDNQLVKGKIVSLRALNDSILKELEETMPQSVTDYRQMLSKSAPGSVHIPEITPPS